MALAKLDKEYLPITGLATFTQNAAKLAYGADSIPLNQNAVSFARSTSLRNRANSAYIKDCSDPIHLRNWCPQDWRCLPGQALSWR